MIGIVQARFSSARLPGKMLMDVCGRTLLGRVIDRLSRSKLLEDIIVATSTEASDDAIAHFCEREAVKCRRGPLNDVAERFKQVARLAGAEAFVRISGDSPLLDPALVDRAIGYFRQSECDLVTNVHVRSFPKGQSVEVVRCATFADVCASVSAVEDREHVTKAYYAAPGRYRMVGFTSGLDVGTVNMSVDTATDLAVVKRVIELTAGNPGGWRELLSVYPTALG
jgi:spore coat polysaccharide biosynthesis protein SpsF